MEDSPRDHEVVARAERDRAEDRLERALPFGDERHLVALRVAVERLFVPARIRDGQRHVRVEQERHAVEHQAGSGLRVLREEMPVAQQAFRFRLPLQAAQPLHVLHLRRGVQVVEQRREPAESLVSNQFLGLEPSALVPERDVTLARYAAKLLVDGHHRFPRAACSRSIASNRARKFPFPKPRLPLRSMISKKSVGRSSTGRENSCRR